MRTKEEILEQIEGIKADLDRSDPYNLGWLRALEYVLTETKPKHTIEVEK